MSSSLWPWWYTIHSSGSHFLPLLEDALIVESTVCQCSQLFQRHPKLHTYPLLKGHCSATPHLMKCHSSFESFGSQSVAVLDHCFGTHASRHVKQQVSQHTKFFGHRLLQLRGDACIFRTSKSALLPGTMHLLEAASP